MLTALSIALSVGNVVVMFLLSRYRLAGWYANAIWQFAWLPYDIYSKQYGFLMLFGTYLAIAVLAIRRLRRASGRSDDTGIPGQGAPDSH